MMHFVSTVSKWQGELLTAVTPDVSRRI